VHALFSSRLAQAGNKHEPFWLAVCIPHRRALAPNAHSRTPGLLGQFALGGARIHARQVNKSLVKRESE
jgi:hypothetical protein